MPIDHKCTACGADNKIDAVPQATFDERLKALAAQRDGFKTEADKERAARATLETQSKDWKAAAEKLAAVEAKAEEDSALAAAGLRADAAPHHRGYLRSLYDAAEKPADADKPAFADWLKAQTAAADADPLLLALRATPGQLNTAPPAPAAPGQPPAPRPPAVLPPNSGQPAPAPGGDPQASIMARMNADAAAGRPWSAQQVLEAMNPAPKT